MLLNGQAVAYMHMGKFEDAESVLQDALDKVSLNYNRLIKQQNGNVSWRRHAQIKQLAWPMTERQTGNRKSCLVLSARFSVINWRSRPVAKSAE